MRVQAEDWRSAIDLCRANLDDDPREWDRLISSMFERYGGPEKSMRVLTSMVLGLMDGDAYDQRRALLEVREQWSDGERGRLHVSAPVDAHFEVG